MKNQSEQIERLTIDITLQLTFHVEKKFVCMVEWNDIFSTDSLGIVDIWQMNKGEFIQFTNRLDDIRDEFKEY